MIQGIRERKDKKEKRKRVLSYSTKKKEKTKGKIVFGKKFRSGCEFILCLMLRFIPFNAHFTRYAYSRDFRFTLQGYILNIPYDAILCPF